MKKRTHNIAREHSYWIVSTIDPKAIDRAGCNIINTATSTQVSIAELRFEIRINILRDHNHNKTLNIYLQLVLWIADPVGACLILTLVAKNTFYARKPLSICTEILPEHIACLDSVLCHEAVPFVTKGDIFFDSYIITSVNYDTTLVRRSHKILANNGTRDILTKVKVDGLVIRREQKES